MAGLKVYELTTQGTLLGTDWLVVQRGTDPAKKRSINNILNDGLSVSFSSGNFSSDVTTGDDLILSSNDSGRILGTTSASELAALMYLNSSDNLMLGAATNINSVYLHYFGSKKLETVSGGVQVTGAYLPFTGCHIAKSNEDLKLGELVQIKSVGWVNPKQPDWIAEYCNSSKKGVYGVVYDVREYDYLIAAVGDGFIEVDCACEYGDVLIPSETKGLATVYKGDYVPLNSVGFAGEDSEGGKISWVKE